MQSLANFIYNQLYRKDENKEKEAGNGQMFRYYVIYLVPLRDLQSFETYLLTNYV